MDAEQVVFNEAEKKLYLDNWSPRENITYSLKEISVDEAWVYATRYASDRIEKARRELNL